MTGVTYNPTVFDVTSLAEAQAIILTPEDGLGTSTRWAVETPYLGELIRDQLNIGPRSLVLDYGCGIGRLSKELIDRTGCHVLGVDISVNMRILATRYVNSPRFTALAPEMLAELVNERGLQVDASIAVWVLQHCWKVKEDIELIRCATKHGGGLLVVNEERRCVPTVEVEWVDDGLNVPDMLKEGFSPRSRDRLPAEITSAASRERTYWQSYTA
jgi:cyclopropane fatty-acyl-phospholipid synthase-like methyltransferase